MSDNAVKIEQCKADIAKLQEQLEELEEGEKIILLAKKDNGVAFYLTEDYLEFMENHVGEWIFVEENEYGSGLDFCYEDEEDYLIDNGWDVLGRGTI